MDVVARNLAAAFPVASREPASSWFPWGTISSATSSDHLLVLLAAVAFLLLIVCGNMGRYAGALDEPLACHASLSFTLARMKSVSRAGNPPTKNNARQPQCGKTKA